MKRDRGWPNNLKVASALRGRRVFDESEQWEYANAVKGYFKGECPFDKLTGGLTSDIKVINDIRIADGQMAQLDALVVTDSAIFLFELKYYEGPVSIRDGQIFVNEQSSVNDPLERLGRAKKLLEKKLYKNRLQLPVVAKLVFMNPDMLIYGNHPD